jgi:hypothetical protein
VSKDSSILLTIGSADTNVCLARDYGESVAVQENVAQSITTRPLAEGDMAGVAALYLRRLRKPGIESADDARELLQRTLVDDPWADDAIPSLVSVAPDGTIVGFIGSSVRHVRLDGEPLRAAYASHLVADPDFPNRTIGLFLLRAFLRGPQDLTLTDTATVQARALWAGLGSVPLHHLATGWLQPLRPLGAIAAAGRSRGGRLALAARALGSVAPLLDHGTGRIAGEARSLRADSVAEEELTPQAVLEHLAECARPARLVPDYDEPFLAWLFRELVAGEVRGQARFRLIRVRGAVVGWYVYYLDPGGLCRVLQVMTRERHAGLVVGELYREAYAGGAAALYGRLEPHTSEAVLRRGALLRPIPRALVHTRRSDAVDALQRGESALAWLDGEPW